MIEKVWDPSRLRDKILLRAIERRRPLSCIMELTYRCNFRCRMCYIRMTDAQAAPYGRMRTAEEWLGMARQVRDAGVLYLTLTGGECTQYPGFPALYEELSRMGFRVSLMSNAGAYDEAVRDVLRRYPPVSVGITLYGGSSETYAAVTGDPRGLDKVRENIGFLRAAGIPVGLNFTMIRQNVLDYPKVAGLCRELGLPFTLITDITEHRYRAEFSEVAACRLSTAQRVCVACHPPEEAALAMENAPALDRELAEFRPPEAPEAALPPEADACIGSVTGCAIYWNGEMGPCISLREFHPVKPFEIGFEAAWAQLKAEQDTVFRRPPVCQACGMRSDCMHNCAGRRFEGTGSPHEPDLLTCQYTWLLRRYRARRKAADVPPSPPCA